MNDKVKARLIKKLAEKAKIAGTQLLIFADEVEQGKASGQAGGNAALWTIHNLWTSSEYRAIEELLRQDGARSALDKVKP